MLLLQTEEDNRNKIEQLILQVNKFWCKIKLLNKCNTEELKNHKQRNVILIVYQNHTYSIILCQSFSVERLLLKPSYPNISH